MIIEYRMKNSNITDKWEKTGLLQGLKGPDKTRLAEWLENTSVVLMEHMTEDKLSAGKTELLMNTIFPVARRLFSSGFRFDPLVMFNEYCQFIDYLHINLEFVTPEIEEGLVEKFVKCLSVKHKNNGQAS